MPNQSSFVAKCSDFFYLPINLTTGKIQGNAYYYTNGKMAVTYGFLCSSAFFLQAISSAVAVPMQMLAGGFSSTYQFSKINIDQGLSELKDGVITSLSHLRSAIVYPCLATGLALGRTLNLFHHLNNWNVESKWWDKTVN